MAREGMAMHQEGFGVPCSCINHAPTLWQLYETAHKAYRDKSKVKFITFPEKLGLGHDYISFNPELPALVK